MSNSELQADSTDPGPYGALMEIARRPAITFTRGQGGLLWVLFGEQF